MTFQGYYCSFCGESGSVEIDRETTTVAQLADVAKRHHIIERHNPSCEGGSLEFYIDAPWPSDLTREQAREAVAVWAKAQFPDASPTPSAVDTAGGSR